MQKDRQIEAEEQQKFEKLNKLKEYKELLENDIITQEEFEAKKKELLGQ